MSKIEEYLKQNDNILVFDVDGVLAKMEYGEYNHYNENDYEWTKKLEQGNTYYDDSVSFETMKNYLKNKNMDNIYVCTQVMNELEFKIKVDFLKRNYNIKEENIFYVINRNDKLKILNKIKEKYKDLADYKIALIDDNVDILTYIMENSKYATIHISSFYK